MKRMTFGVLAVVALTSALGLVACKKDTNNDEDMATSPDLKAMNDMAMSQVMDMAMREPGIGQVIVAEVEGKVYQNTDGGSNASAIHAIAAIAQFNEFQPLIGANDDSDLNLMGIPSGCTIQTFVPGSGDLPEAQANAGAVSGALINGGILGVSSGSFSTPAPLPTNGTAIGCQLGSQGGVTAYGCAFVAADNDMSTSPWQGKLTGTGAFPILSEAVPPVSSAGGVCGNLSANYVDSTPGVAGTGLCIPHLLGSGLNITVAGQAGGPFSAATTASKVTIPVSAAGVTVTAVKVGANTLTLPVDGSAALTALDGHFDADSELEIDFTCGAGCSESTGADLALVGLLAQTSAAPRGDTAPLGSKFAVAECVTLAEATGKVTMKAAQVAKLRAAAAGGSIQFTLARLNAQLDASAGSHAVIRGAGRGQFAYINQ